MKEDELKFKGTTGEWTYDENKYFCEVRTKEKSKRHIMVCNVILLDPKSAYDSISISDENRANAQLIATAPKMIEALIEVRTAIWHLTGRMGEQMESHLNTMLDEVIEEALKVNPPKTIENE